MSQNPSSHPAAHDDAGSGSDPAQARRARRARLVLPIAAVILAVIGLLSLAVVLLSAWAGAEAWPGFMTAAYFCLPLGFLLMTLSVVVSVVSRGRG
jgi:TRAP-type C4-dicarboxylate transport system permease small subunit